MDSADRERDAAEKAAALAALEERLETELAAYARSKTDGPVHERAARAADEATAELAAVAERFGLPAETAVRLEATLWPDEVVRHQPPAGGRRPAQPDRERGNAGR